MKKSSGLAALVFIALSILPCYAHHIAVVVAKDSTVESVSSAGLARLFKAETRKWPDGKNVVLVLHRDSAAQLEVMERLIKISEGDLKAFIASHKESVLLTDTDVDIIKVVETVPGAIGLVDVRSINSKIKVLKVDGKLPMDEGYLPHH